MLTLLLSALVAIDSTRYVVINHGREAGDLVIRRSADTIDVRYQHVDRNRGVVAAKRYLVDPRGRAIGGESRQWTFGQEMGPASDRFEIVRDSLLWGIAPPQSGGSRLEPDMFPRLRATNTAYDQAQLAKFLLSRPDRRGRLMPGGTPMRAEVVTELTVGSAARRERVKLVAVYTANAFTPAAIWLDARNELFAGGVEWFIPVRAGMESSLPALRTAELKWRNAMGVELAKKLTPAKPTHNLIMITNGDVFDSERGVIIPNTSVLIQDGRIVALGLAPGTFRYPGVMVTLDATGKTIVPGLWDMHGHLQHTSQTSGGLMQLANGLTTVRDLAADTDVATWYRDGVNSGTLVGSRAILGGFVEGPGKWAGPGDVIVRTEDEARRAVASFDSLGYRQIKLYNLVHPDLVPTIAAETRRRGMRLSGHVPRGLTVPAAIALGFDEINHAAFLFSTWFQDSLYVPTMRAYSAVASAVAPNVDVNGPQFTSMIDYMRSKGTVLDGTFNIWVGSTAAAVGASASQKGTENYLRLIQRLDSAGVVMVPGTDNTTGSTYITELETYVRAGLSPAKVLQMATITSARVMRDDAEYGSIAPGKVADLLIVNGKPHERITDLRNIETVIRAGRIYTPTQLRQAMIVAPPAPAPR